MVAGGSDADRVLSGGLGLDAGWDQVGDAVDQCYCFCRAWLGVEWVFSAFGRDAECCLGARCHPISSQFHGGHPSREQNKIGSTHPIFESDRIHTL